MKLVEIKLPDTSMFSNFCDLYNLSFPDDSEREDTQLFRDRLEKPWDGGAKFHLIVATRDEWECLGGVVLEYYPESECGLITYVCVDERYRQLGIAADLIREAIRTFVDDSHNLRAIYVETEDPYKVTGGIFDPKVRFEFWGKLGFRPTGLSYIQPALGAGQNPCDNLLLLSHGKVPVQVTESFIREFYAAFEDLK